MKLLVVEDSDRLRRSLYSGLTRLGYKVDTAADGQTALAYAERLNYDVIILDLMLPILDGFDFLREIRSRKNGSRVLILSAKELVEDKVKGLTLGADDYLTKPFSFEELNARLLSLYRRPYEPNAVTYAIGSVKIDTALRQAEIDGNELPLTPLEYSILEKLSICRGRVLTYGQLEKHLYSYDSEVSRNALEAHVSSLRRKLKSRGIENMVKTRRGFGYYISSRI